MEQGGFPVVKPGLDEFTPKGRRKVIKALLEFVLVGVALFALIAFQILHNGEFCYRGRCTPMTPSSLPWFAIAIIVIFGFCMADQVYVMFPNKRYLYFRPYDIAGAYGFENILRDKPNLKLTAMPNGDVAMSGKQRSKLSFGMFRIEKSSVPMSYTTLATIPTRNTQANGKKRHNKNKEQAVCRWVTIEFSADGATMHYAGQGSFPAASKATYQSFGNALTLD
ncbi:hypothetical protein [Bifidobacterium sp. ESL0790]|uniref:hypothetical protein n=1 Tax=Bifidobacterium sp. ESL0790 TaxID=2983233 RepID=UPI0023F6451B|nr:hypothetical protein [Bifidobacterium sp. ESL0790]WEV72589.1 hypothetical protein OZY47_00960 [Bifidobacterium sp. ESL0790]